MAMANRKVILISDLVSQSIGIHISTPIGSLYKYSIPYYSMGPTTQSFGLCRNSVFLRTNQIKFFNDFPIILSI